MIVRLIPAFIGLTIMLSRFSISYNVPLFSKRWKLLCTSIDIATEDENMQTTFRRQKAEPGHVYYVATPLGNIGDITYRARDILSTVDVIYAEDTRNTIRLLKFLSIPQKEIHSHHDHNQRESIDTIVQRAREGASIAVVSDAGTPGISDPGAPLAAALAENLIPIHPVPGPSAVISAMSIAGFTNSEFTFFGFVPVKGSERIEKLQAISDTKHTAVIYEAPHRILKTLKDLLQANPAMRTRSCVCCRELTKLHEEIKRDSIENILIWLQKQHDTKENGSGIGIRGEFTVLFGPLLENQKKEWSMLRQSLMSTPSEHLSVKEETDVKELNSAGSDQFNPEDAKDMVQQALEIQRKENVSRSEAVKKVSKQLKAPRNIVYSIALKMEW